MSRRSDTRDLHASLNAKDRFSLHERKATPAQDLLSFKRLLLR